MTSPHDAGGVPTACRHAGGSFEGGHNQPSERGGREKLAVVTSTHRMHERTRQGGSGRFFLRKFDYATGHAGRRGVSSGQAGTYPLVGGCACA
eukprot:3129397-Prymnesium_polylepis.4